MGRAVRAVEEAFEGEVNRQDIEKSGLDWVVAGGESGPGARSLQSDWVCDLRDQCADAQVPFFFKQWGGVRKKETGRLLDGVEHSGYPT